MKRYYVTLNRSDEARQIGRALLEKQLAICVNWFPITCAYRWEGEITEEPEVVLIIKTQDGYRNLVEQTIRQFISYTNFIAKIAPSNVNPGFLEWLNKEVPIRPYDLSTNPQDQRSQMCLRLFEFMRCAETNAFYARGDRATVADERN